MRLLLCVELYFPSRGGAQEVVRQLAEKLAARGHQVTVATSQIQTRKLREYKGVRIEEFAVSGNQVRGLVGEVDRYRNFLVEGDYDLTFFYAAQQWTFDAAWPVINRIRGKKVFVPCGYSGLYAPQYKKYFEGLPSILREFDCVVYHAVNYRDYEFGVRHGINRFQIIPNGADDQEFAVTRDSGFRQRLGIADDALLLLTVGTLTGQKGHLELAKAFDLASFPNRCAVLMLNGNTPARNGIQANTFSRVLSLVTEWGWRYAAKHFLKKLLWSVGVKVGKTGSIAEWVDKINAQHNQNKRVILCDLPRLELIQAYLNADLFVFASNVEYSPLVLFEACAAGVPFLSVPVGNSVEIAAWTGGGAICPADVDERGYTRVSPDELARRMESLIADRGRCADMGHRGKLASQERYNWNMLAQEYEALFARLINETAFALEEGSERSTRQCGETGNRFG